MRRALASLLLAAFGFPPLAPVLSRNGESNLPECCRRGGKHHCAMMTDDTPVNGVSFKSIPQRCPLYPSAAATPAGQHLAVGTRPPVVPGAGITHHAISARTQPGHRAAFCNSCRKRGPPALA